MKNLLLCSLLCIFYGIYLLPAQPDEKITIVFEQDPATVRLHDKNLLAFSPVIHDACTIAKDFHGNDSTIALSMTAEAWDTLSYFFKDIYSLQLSSKIQEKIRSEKELVQLANNALYLEIEDIKTAADALILAQMKKEEICTALIANENHPYHNIIDPQLQRLCCAAFINNRLDIGLLAVKNKRAIVGTSMLTLQGPGSDALCVVYGDDRDTKIASYNLKTKAWSESIDVGSSNSADNTKKILCLLSNNQCNVVTTQLYSLPFGDIISNTSYMRQAGHTGTRISSFSCHPLQDVVLTLCNHKNLCFWDKRTMQKIDMPAILLNGIVAAFYIPNGNGLVLIGEDDGHIKIYPLRADGTCNPLKETPLFDDALDNHIAPLDRYLNTRTITNIICNKAGTFLVACYDRGDKMVIDLSFLRTPILEKKTYIFRDDDSRHGSLAINNNGDVVWSNKHKLTKVHIPEAEQKNLAYKGEEVTALQFHPTNQNLLAVGDTYGACYLMNIETNCCVHIPTHCSPRSLESGWDAHGCLKQVENIHFSGDGSMLAIATKGKIHRKEISNLTTYLTTDTLKNLVALHKKLLAEHNNHTCTCMPVALGQENRWYRHYECMCPMVLFCSLLSAAAIVISVAATVH